MAKCHITRPSVIHGETLYYRGDLQWSETFGDRKIYNTLAEARIRIEPVTTRLGDKDVSNANGAFKNASVVNE